ncbi:hypothetical protein DFH27DRAFT_522780 [Peziza echinospora]|nr:hypothetical protein DFH27DRAFT_522780 [Peziza echinospora]
MAGAVWVAVGGLAEGWLAGSVSSQSMAESTGRPLNALPVLSASAMRLHPVSQSQAASGKKEHLMGKRQKEKEKEKNKSVQSQSLPVCLSVTLPALPAMPTVCILSVLPRGSPPLPHPDCVDVWNCGGCVGSALCVGAVCVLRGVGYEKRKDQSRVEVHPPLMYSPAPPPPARATPTADTPRPAGRRCEPVRSMPPSAVDSGQAHGWRLAVWPLDRPRQTK